MIRAVAIWLLLATPVFALDPSEILDDPALEERAREISAELRCLVCRNESIDESSASLARDLRVLVRERLVAGDSDEEVLDFVVARYGEYVLLSPRAEGSTLILWLAPLAGFLLAFGVAMVYLRGRNWTETDRLSPEEERRLREILDE